MIKLENLNHPLMVKLARVASGTYNHSLNVAELATSGAKDIGLDPEYLRLGGYFHDIGKIKNPKIFIENKSYDRYAKNVNFLKISRAIIEHVTYGQKLARQYNLPDEVVEYVGQHHGSSTIESLKGKVPVKNLQYPGPKPLSRKAAILMLADSIEAHVRSLNSKTEKKIIETVNYEIDHKASEGQLDLSGLSMKEVNLLKKSYVKSVLSIYHMRKI